MGLIQSTSSIPAPPTGSFSPINVQDEEFPILHRP